ncbi:class I adenylate-forming enzyme family protein [Brevibacterium casei]|uniref:Acyl-CoA synthetase (AMP-forming)/AMP-acid ligase II n=1 Tax=Brevibacterium casei CIP 102111 TaxID=1255625 RepID=A0A2H1JAL4_9MICO|nr:class I adenylate-forming enzyme family protein [Brevibacterium casei]QPR38925.1 acyl--CoA ligase [Brevibacterium casei]QPR43091.1 acyl--CoA ligase [Brevibacterium casei]SMX84404.1 Acyl-CoA synthetase (AMP-forming)/AMP-acid ligase II [Brevibacterium casei CIP 102111]
MPITEAVLETARTHPDRPAIVGEDARLSYAGLVADSRSLAAAVDALHRAQSHPPRPAPETAGIPITAVSLASAFTTARIVAGLAGFRAVSATIDPRWPLNHQVGVITATGIGLVISDSPSLAEALAGSGWTGTVVTAAELAAEQERRCDRAHALGPDLPSPSVRGPDEAFLMLFSSGTTSDPKAFLKTREQYRANVAVSSAHLEPLPGVVTLAPGPVSYSLTLYAVIESLATGGTIHVADEFAPLPLGRRIAEESVTRIVAVPAVVAALAEAADRDPDRFVGLDLVVTGGANLPAAIRDRLAEVLLDTRLISYYGAAEIGFIGDSRDGDGTWIEIYPTIAAEIRDETGDPVPEGELGTLWILAAACSDGYLAGTTDAVLRGPDGWASVDDQGRMVDGRLQLAGRAGDIAVTGGHKVALPEVERAFATLPRLGEAVAIALPDSTLGSLLALVVEDAGVVDDGDTGADKLGAGDHGPEHPDKSALLAHARSHLAPQFVPRRFYALPRLPRTVGGKIRRTETVDLIVSGEGTRL